MVQDHYRFTLQALLKPKECACHSHGVLLNFSPASLPLAGAEYIAVVYTLWADCSYAVIALICDNQLPFWVYAHAPGLLEFSCASQAISMTCRVHRAFASPLLPDSCDTRLPSPESRHALVL